MFRRFCISLLSLAALLLCGEAVAQQPAVQARIAGLESNEEYMSLLRRDAQLQVREDSIMRVVSGMRHRLHDEPDNRQRYTQEILPLVRELFAFVRDFSGEIPGARPEECGNYLDQNLPMAQWLAARYLERDLAHAEEEGRLSYQ